MVDVFQFIDYKAFLNHKLDELDGIGRGSRARLSRSIDCHTAYTAQVLRGTAHFSLEQAEAINDFLGHTSEQGDYFLLILQWARAASPKLKSRLRRHIKDFTESRSLLKNRLDVEGNLEEREQMIYYSSWTYGAVHALVSLPGFQSAEKIAKRLGLSLKQSVEALGFLERSGILERRADGNLGIGKKRIHLGADSPMIKRHHLNWRLRAIQAIESDPLAGLHYSSVVSISKSDYATIRELLVRTIQQTKEIVRTSPDEELVSWSLDVFQL